MPGSTASRSIIQEARYRGTVALGYLKSVIRTRFRFGRRRESANCVPSRDVANQTMVWDEKSVIGFGGSPVSGNR